jgi:hypothetical protein
MPTEAQLKQILVSEHKMLDKFKENKTIILDCPLSKLWELCFADDCVLPFNLFQKECVASANQSVETWIHEKGSLPPLAKIKVAYNIN